MSEHLDVDGTVISCGDADRKRASLARRCATRFAEAEVARADAAQYRAERDAAVRERDEHRDRAEAANHLHANAEHLLTQARAEVATLREQHDKARADERAAIAEWLTKHANETYAPGTDGHFAIRYAIEGLATPASAAVGEAERPTEMVETPAITKLLNYVGVEGTAYVPAAPAAAEPGTQDGVRADDPASIRMAEIAEQRANIIVNTCEDCGETGHWCTCNAVDRGVA